MQFKNFQKKIKKICFLRMLWHFKNGLINILLYGTYDPPEYIVFEREKLIYIVIAKCGCSSIKKSLAYLILGQDAQDIKDDYSAHKVNFKTLRHLNRTYLTGHYTIFTCIRDPLERLKSCYTSKYISDVEKFKKQEKDFLDFDGYLLGYLKKKPSSFEHFLKKIMIIPGIFQDRHFKSFYDGIGGKKVINNTYIFLLEDADRGFEPIRKKFNLPKLGVLNKSCGGGLSVISEKTLFCFRRKFKSDISLFSKISNLHEYSHRTSPIEKKILFENVIHTNTTIS